jgi:hypothetical protein
VKAPPTPLDDGRIAILAYTYWEQRGRPQASPETDWFHAVASLAPVVQDGLPISSFSLEPNEGPWLDGRADLATTVSPRPGGRAAPPDGAG